MQVRRIFLVPLYLRRTQALHSINSSSKSLEITPLGNFWTHMCGVGSMIVHGHADFLDLPQVLANVLMA